LRNHIFRFLFKNGRKTYLKGGSDFFLVTPDEFCYVYSCGCFASCPEFTSAGGNPNKIVVVVCLISIYFNCNLIIMLCSLNLPFHSIPEFVALRVPLPSE
jgi:hypothetical protein